MKPKILLLSICLIWGVWLANVVYSVKSHVNEDMIVQKRGLIIDARCADSRSTRRVVFTVKYDNKDAVTKDIIILRPETVCDEALLDRLKMKRIEISAYKNYYLGIIVDGLLLRDTDESIREINNKTDVIIFTFVVALSSSFVLFKLTGRGKRHDRTPIAN